MKDNKNELTSLGKDELFNIAKKIKHNNADLILGTDIVIINRNAYDMLKQKNYNKKEIAREVIEEIEKDYAKLDKRWIAKNALAHIARLYKKLAELKERF